MKGMYGPRLADAIDATGALLQAHRVPRQLEVDHRPARAVQVEPLAGGVRREEDRSRLQGKCRERSFALVPGHASMEYQRWKAVERPPEV